MESVIRFEKVEPARDKSAARWLRWLDAEVFPDDVPFGFQMASWFVGWEGRDGVAYCGWKPVLQGSRMVGFHYRAGVLASHRGRRLQRKMLLLRERDMRRQNVLVAVTYTDAGNAASMRSLIGSGYRPYAPTKETHLADGRAGFVHWRKDL